MKNLTMVLLVAVSLMVVTSCGTSTNLSGEYICIELFGGDAMVGELSLDFGKDGTVIMKPLNSKGDYSIEGNTVTVELEAFDLTFTKDGDILTSSDGTVVYEKK